MKYFALPLALASFAAAQTPTNLFDIYSGCTNYTSRSSLAANAGEILLQVPATHFAGVCQDNAGTGTSLSGFQFVVQDYDASTAHTYFMVVRGDLRGTPDVSSTGLLLRAGPLRSPTGTSSTPTAWLITVTLASPSTAVPLCNTFYHGVELTSTPTWPLDGLSFHITTHYLTGGTQADNPAPNAPSLGWDVVGGAAVQPGPARSIRFSLMAPAAMLKLGNNDPTLTNPTNCVTSLGNTSFGAGGMWPRAQGAAGPRNDGLNFRVRDAANAGGFAVVWLGQNLGCPGLPLPGLANGALFLNPGGPLLQLASAQLDASGVATGVLLPASPTVAAALNRAVDCQAFTTTAALTLPGKLSNRASVVYLP